MYILMTSRPKDNKAAKDKVQDISTYISNAKHYYNLVKDELNTQNFDLITHR